MAKTTRFALRLEATLARGCKTPAHTLALVLYRVHLLQARFVEVLKQYVFLNT